MLKTGTKFDSKIDQRNIEKNNQIEQKSQIWKKARRIQELTTDAPISISNLKKRKATLEPQSSVSDKSTGSSKNSPEQNLIKNLNFVWKLTVYLIGIIQP